MVYLKQLKNDEEVIVAKIKSIIVAHGAKMNSQLGGAVDILGSFDNIVQPVFPHPLAKLSILLTFEEITKPTAFEVRLNGPDDDLISRGELTPLVDQFGVGKKIVDIDRFLVKNRGKYTIDVFEKNGDELKFLKTETLFIADYPPKRNLTQEQIDAIIADESLIKSVKTEFRAFGMENPIKLQYNLQKDMPIAEGFIEIPENNTLVIGEETVDLTGIRRQIEWMFGNPIPKEEIKEEKKNVIKELKNEKN